MALPEDGLVVACRPASNNYPCPCCGYLTFSEPPGSYDICDICGWEDDEYQLDDPEAPSGANGVSLVQAQRNYSGCGVSDPAIRKTVRKSTQEDLRDDGWRLFEDSDYICSVRGETHGFRHENRSANGACLYYWRPTYWRRQPH
jgi:hypothetical protein